MSLVAFLRGATAMGWAIVGLFFFRFWRSSLDRFYLLFAIAFWLLAFENAVLGVVAFATEWHAYVLLVRLIAFCLILYVVVERARR